MKMTWISKSMWFQKYSSKVHYIFILFRDTVSFNTGNIAVQYNVLPKWRLYSKGSWISFVIYKPTFATFSFWKSIFVFCLKLISTFAVKTRKCQRTTVCEPTHWLLPVPLFISWASPFFRKGWKGRGSAGIDTLHNKFNISKRRLFYNL